MVLCTILSDEVFAGSKNPIVLKREFYQEFTCDFDLLWYPFDRQVSKMIIFFIINPNLLIFCSRSVS